MRFHGIHRDSSNGCDLAIRTPLAVVQREDDAGLYRDGGHPGLQQRILLAPDEVSLRRFRDEEFQAIDEARRSQAAQSVDARICKDAVEPRIEPPVGIVRGTTLVEAKKRLLNGILGLGTIPHQARGHGERSTLVSPHKDGECLAAPRLNPLEDRLVAVWHARASIRYTLDEEKGVSEM
jgi:hypothetical protein